MSERSDVQEKDTLLHVYLFGEFRFVWRVPSAAEPTLWESRTSARSLLKLLLCTPGRQASRSMLAGILWPETDEEKARESLRSAQKVLRKVLRTAQGEDLLTTRNNGEILVLAEQARLWVDTDAFEEMIALAARTPSSDEALALWEKARGLLCGEFLADDQGYEWAGHRVVKRRRQALWMARCRMIRHLADLYIERRETGLAEEMLEQHITQFPTDQDALYRLLGLLGQQGCFEEARVLYERTRRALEGVGKQPAEHVQTLYERFQEAHPSIFPALPAPANITEQKPEPDKQKRRTRASIILREAAHPMAIDGPVDAVGDILRVLLAQEREGKQEMSLLSRRQVLELGIAAFITRLAQIDGKRISAVEREELGRALGQSIADSWKLFLSLENAQVVAIGRAQLSLIHQAHTLISPSALPYFYAGTHGFIGIGLHCQERDDEALQHYHNGYIAALATNDPWYIAQNLICQADSYHTLGQYHAAIQAIEEALRVLATTSDEDEKMIRTRAHLLTCWADNAMMLHDDRTTQEKLEVSATHLISSVPDEEFDWAAWSLIAGKYALHTRDYTTAKCRFQEALPVLPERWLLRRAMTALGLAMASGRLGERDYSLTIARDLVPLLKAINTPMTNRWFIEYQQQDLLGIFPGDRAVKEFVAEAYRQLPQATNLIPSSK